MSDAPGSSFGTLDLDEGMIALIKPELDPGERIMWAGRSMSGTRWEGPRFLTPAAFRAGVVLGVAATCFLLAMLFGRQIEPLDVLLMFAGTIVGMVGLVWLGKLIAAGVAKGRDQRRRERQVFALTDKRAIFWLPGNIPAATIIQALPLEAIDPTNIRRVQFPDDSGDLLFYSDPRGAIGFEGIADVRRVERLLRGIL